MDVPYCTLKSFPATIEHTIQWARDKVHTLLCIVLSPPFFWQGAHARLYNTISPHDAREFRLGSQYICPFAPSCLATLLHHEARTHIYAICPSCLATLLQQEDRIHLLHFRITGLESICTQYAIRNFPHCHITGLESISIFPARRDTARHDTTGPMRPVVNQARPVVNPVLLGFSLSFSCRLV